MKRGETYCSVNIAETSNTTVRKMNTLLIQQWLSVSDNNGVLNNYDGGEKRSKYVQKGTFAPCTFFICNPTTPTHTHTHTWCLQYKVSLQVHNKCIKNIPLQMIYISTKRTNSKFLLTRFYL